MIIKTVYFVRHGESLDNVLQAESNPDTTQSDSTSLSVLGRRQSTLLAGRIKKSNTQKMYSSDLTRAKETSEIVKDALGIPVVYEVVLREVDNDETFESRKNRAEKVLDLLKNAVEEEILVVAHGGIIKSIFARMLNGEEMNETEYWRFMQFTNIRNASISISKLTHDGRWKLVNWNEIAYLEDSQS